MTWSAVTLIRRGRLCCDLDRRRRITRKVYHRQCRAEASPPAGRPRAANCNWRGRPETAGAEQDGHQCHGHQHGDGARPPTAGSWSTRNPRWPAARTHDGPPGNLAGLTMPAASGMCQRHHIAHQRFGCATRTGVDGTGRPTAALTNEAGAGLVESESDAGILTGRRAADLSGPG